MKSKEFISPEVENKSVEELTRQLFEANLELTRLQKERETMLANISHDLRAPITAIRGAIDLLLSSGSDSKTAPSPEDMLKTAKLIDRRTATLEDLINDMYYLFSVNDRSRELSLEEIDAGPFLEEYFFDETTDPRYDNFDMQLCVPEDLHCKINIDVQKVIRVLDNLLTNAAKYAGAGCSISLGASYDRPAGKLSITLSDTGRGIAPEDVERIFLRTFRVSDARTPESSENSQGRAGHAGSGLGLSIAKAIIERHGGDIRCESCPGKGTSFIITLDAHD